MSIKIGRTRIVLLLPFLHVVLKFSRIQLLRVFKQIIGRLSRGQKLGPYFSKSVDYHHYFKEEVFGGLVANVREYKFYKNTHHPFLEPTYLSLGFVNIQRLDPPCEKSSTDLWMRLYAITKGDTFKDSHVFANPRNFCVREGKLRIVDYASKEAQSVIKRYGRRIIREFDVR